MKEKDLSIAFTGDIAFDKFMDHQWEDDQLVAKDVVDYLQSADHVVVDVEGPISAFDQDPEAKGMSNLLHTIDPAAVKVLDRIGADVWDINNNHMMDIGDKGLFDTLEAASKAGAKTVGAGRNIDEAAKPVYFKEAGGVGIFAVGYRGVTLGCKPATKDKAGCLQWNQDEIIRNNIAEIKSKCRWCIIVCHGGEEFTALPAPYVRDRYLSYLDMGADIVVGHHPHVPNNYETFPQKAIFYSLGNFIFDTDYQRSQFNTERGVLLKLFLNEDDFYFEPLGIEIQRGCEHIVRAELPDIFVDVQQEEYDRLIPLEAKMFLDATKRQYRFLFPEKYSDFTEEDWKNDFLDPNRFERIEGEVLDHAYMYQVAQKANDGAWKESALTKVVDYILAQMEPEQEVIT